MAPKYVVDGATGCWVWQGRKLRGYGKMGRSAIAHRVYYERVHGAIAEGLDLDHLCRNRSCVNPEHMEPVTRAENARRGARAKLDWDTVRAIRSTPGTLREVAEAFGVHHRTIHDVRRRASWWPEPTEAHDVVA